MPLSATHLIYIALAFISGGGVAIQVSMLGAMGSLRSPSAAVWVSLLATAAGLSAVLAIRNAGSGTGLPVPFDRAWVMAAVAALSTLALALSVRGVPPYLILTGLMSLPFLIGSGFLIPRIGVGLYLASAIAGQLMGALLLDQIGAFGGHVYRIDLLRGLGVLALLSCVILVRGVR